MKNLKTGLTIIFIMICFIGNAQNLKKVDSLFAALNTEKIDTSCANIYFKLFKEFYKSNPDTAMYFAKQALRLSIKTNWKKGEAKAYNSIGIIYQSQGNYPEALKNHFASLKIREEIGDKQGIATSYNNIGNIYKSQGNYPEALKNYFASLKIFEEIGRLHPELVEGKQGIATSLNNIGFVYYNQGNYPEALKNHFESLKKYEEIGDKLGIAASYNNIGIVYYNQGNYPEALKNYLTSLKIREEIGDKQGIATSYNNIGIIYKSQGNYPEALKNHFASLKINEEIGDKKGIAFSYNNIGTLHIKLHKNTEAQNYLNKGLQLSKEIGDKESIKYSYKGLSELDNAMGIYKLQLEHYKLYIIYRDSLNNEETKKKTIESAMTYEFEKKELAAKAEQDKKDILAAAENRKQKVIKYSVIGGLVLVLIFLVFVYRSLRITRKQKKIIEKQKLLVDEKNLQLNQQNEEIRTQKDEIEAQRDHIEEIHQEVTDSINYAKRIQQAVLPVSESARAILGDHFILFKPKDIVSGDFYFAEKRKKLLLVAVADCTGHGVPGAFMSMLGISFLNEIIAKEHIQSASQVLDELRNSIIHSLQQKGIEEQQNTSENHSVKDGMDIVFIILNTETNILQFAGANNPLWIVKNNGTQMTQMQATQIYTDNEINQRESVQSALSAFHLEEVNPDKMPVAIYEKMQPFTNHEIQLHSGDIIYLASDGYEDQFGGLKGKKFMSKKLKQLLAENCNKSMTEQREILENTIEDWKNNYGVKYEQIDDITVMGIKIC